MINNWNLENMSYEDSVDMESALLYMPIEPPLLYMPVEPPYVIAPIDDSER